MISTMYWPDIVHGIGVVLNGEFSRGVAMLSACAGEFQDLGHNRAAAQALLFLGQLQAAVAAGAEHCYLPVSQGRVAVPVAQNLSDTADNAHNLLSGALDLARDTQMSGIAALALDGLAQMARLRSDHARAASWAEEARTEAAAVGWPHPVGDDSPVPAG